MQEAHFVSILAHPRVDACAQASANQSKNLAITFTLRGANATSFSKDLSDEFSTWQVDNPEQLHQRILDLLSTTRQKELELEFALSLLTSTSQIIFATYNGKIILKRHEHVKKILESEREIKIIVGSFKDNDQIVFINKSASAIESKIMAMLESDYSLAKLVSEASLLREECQDLNESLVFLTYKEAKTPIELEQERNKKRKITLQKIQIFAQKIIASAKKIFVSIQKQDKKKLARIGAGLMGVLIIGIISTAIIKNKNQQILSNIQKQIAKIEQSTSNIDQLVLSQPLLARENAKASLVALEQLKKEKNSPASLKLLEEKIKQFQELINTISGDNALDRLSIAYNLDNFLGKKIVSYQQEFFILENSGQEILRLKIDGSSNKISLPDNQAIKDFTISEDKLFILSSGLYLLDLQSEAATISKIKEEGESDKNAEYLNSFGPYLYLLNRNKRNIYRYYYKDDKLSEPIGWLVDKQGINFDNICDLLVNGELWISEKSGKVLKFSKGAPSDFQIKGLSQLPSSPISVSSSPSNKILALLEKQNKRLLLLTPDGQLISEIKSNELAGASSIALSDNDQKIYVLSGSVIYEISL